MPKEPFQAAFDFSGAEKANLNARWDEIAKEAKEDKARARAAENAEYADKRTPKSDLIRQAELDKMKEILNKPKVSGVRGGSGGSSGTGGAGEIKALANPKAMKKGGTASARADGCCIRGKTRA